jgi:signal transduction histidine kinase
MSSYLVASSVVALLVALFNGLLAGSVLASARGERRRLLFACGPVGVALFATGWFVLLVEPRTKAALHVATSLCALLSVSGFALDALLDLGPTPARRRLLTALAPLGLALTAASGWLAAAYGSSFPSVLFQVLGLALVALLGTTRLLLCRHESAPLRQLSRHVVALVVASLLVLALRTVLELSYGQPVGSAVSLCIILAAETVTLSYILHERVSVHLPVSRTLTYAVLSGIVAFAAVAAFRALGSPVDLAQVATTVAVVLLAALLFIGLGQPLSNAFELLLFPKQVRMSGLLSAARSETAALRSRLERAERLAIAGELAASIAHEIKNPLAAVHGYAQLLTGHGPHLPPERRAAFDKALRIIREESDRIDARVAELLNLARAPRSQQPEARLLDVSRVVLEAVAVAEGEPGFPPIAPRLELALKAAVDEDALRGVLLNLLKNAAEATPPGSGGRIEVVAWGEPERVVVEVSDEGQGLGGVEPEQLFRAFYTTKAGGTGLGLAISRSAVEAGGGQLVLRPREDRTGAIARVELPRGS